MTPQRIQRKRTKGWRMGDAVYVGRGSKYGNPWRIWWEPKFRRWVTQADHNATSERFLTESEAKECAVSHFKFWAWRLDVDSLRGKDLACWCPLTDAQGNHVPCHADVLLELANKEEA